QLLHRMPATAMRFVTARRGEHGGCQIADDLSHSDGKRVAVIRRRGKGYYASIVPLLHERIVVERVKDRSGPGALDLALAESAQRREYPLSFFQSFLRHLPRDLG